MKNVNLFALYCMIIVSIVILVLVICLSRTMSVEELSIKQFSVKEDTVNDETNENKYLPENILAFTQNPLEGIKMQESFRDFVGIRLYRDKSDCVALYNTILEECVGTWQKIPTEECEVYGHKMESDCLEPLPDDDKN